MFFKKVIQLTSLKQNCGNNKLAK